MRLWLILFLLLPVPAVAGEDCLKAPYRSANTDAETRLLEIYEKAGPALERFPSLGEAMEDLSPDLCFMAWPDNAHAFLDPDALRIYISPDLSEAMQVGVLMHEIRHLDQIAVGACPSDDLAMRQYALATFALEADASAVSLLVAWDMMENGYAGPWEALSAWESQSDIAARFSEQMIATGDAARAVSAAFDQWYESDVRLKAYYLAACSDYLDRQDANKAIPRYQLLPNDFFDDLCRLPDGTGYPCTMKDIYLR